MIPFCCGQGVVDLCEVSDLGAELDGCSGQLFTLLAVRVLVDECPCSQMLKAKRRTTLIWIVTFSFFFSFFFAAAAVAACLSMTVTASLSVLEPQNTQ